MNPLEMFRLERERNVEAQGTDEELLALSNKWVQRTATYKYSYHFSWLGVPIIQFPQDMVAMQEVIWSIQPDLIVETGVAHGGSLIFYASMLKLLEGERRVVGVDIDIRSHNRKAIEDHPMSKHIKLIEGPSTDTETVEQVKSYVQQAEKVLVVLDSNHTHDHVLEELNLYSPMVSKGGYLVVFDTVIEDVPESFSADRPWGKGNNPKTAVHEFLKSNDRFEVDSQITDKILVTVAPDGYLKCVKD